MNKKALLVLIPFAATALASCTPVSQKKQCSEVEVSYNENEMTIGIDETASVPYIAEDCEGNITWKSSNEDVATVDSNGKVTGHAEGDALITANGATTGVTVHVTGGGIQPGQKGSLENPLTGAEAAQIAEGLEQNKPTAQSYYIKGVVQELKEEYSTQYGNYSFSIESDFICWRLKKGKDGEKFNDGDIEVGDTVVVYAQIQKFYQAAKDDKPERTLLETSGGYVHSVSKAGDPAVVSVEITPNPIALRVGGNKVVSANVRTTGGASNEVEWALSDVEPSGAVTFDATSLKVTGVAKGSAKLTATSKFDSTKKATANITVSEDTGEIVVDKEFSLTLDSLGLTEAGKYFTNESEDLAYVDIGTFNMPSMQFKSKSGKIYNTVPFSKPITKVTVSIAKKAGDDATSNFYFGSTAALGETIGIGSGTSYPLNVENSSFEIIPSAGAKFFKIESTNFASYIKEIKFLFENVEPAVKSVIVSPKSASIEVEETTTLSAVVATEGTASKEVEWTSTNDSVATVSSTGVVTGVATGTATITATSKFDNTKSDTCTITVSPKSDPEVVSVSVSPSEETIKVEETLQLQETVTVKGGAAKTVTWTSDNNTIAEVSSTGLVTAKSEGTAHITVASTVNPGKSAVATIHVEPKPVPAKANVEYNIVNTLTTDSGEDIASTLAQDMPNYLTTGENIITASSGSKVYNGKSSAIKIGNSTGGSLTFTLSNNVTAIIIGAKKYSSDQTTLKINGTEFTPGENYENYEVKVTSTKTVSIECVKRAYVNYIGFVAEGVKPAKEITNVEIVSSPTKLNYVEGQTFDPTGASIKVTYNDESEETLTTGFDFEVARPLAVGESDIHAVYGDVSSTNTVHLTVVAKVLESIEIKSGMSKVKYVSGDAWDSTGIVVEGTYNSGDKETITDCTFTFNPASPEVGITEVDITAHKDSLNSAAFNQKGITVTAEAQPELESIVVKANPTKMTYNEGESFEPAGLVITASYTLEKASEDKAWGTDGLTYSYTGPLKAPSATVTISYTEDGKTVQTTLDITVTATHVNTIKTAYEAAEALESGGVTSQAYTFEGVVTSFQGSTFMLQDGDYAIMVYNKAISGNAVGKTVSVNATLQKYNGLIETKTINSASITGTGTVPSAKSVTSVSTLSGLKQNVLIDVNYLEVVSVENKWASGTDSDWAVKLDGESTVFYLNKYSFVQANKDILSGLAVGDKFSVKNAIVGFKNNVNRISSTNQTVVEKFVPELTGLTIGGDFSKKEYSVGEEWDISGLTFTGTTASGDITLSAASFEFEFSPATATDTSVNSVVVTATYKQNSEISATITINGITVNDEPIEKSVSAPVASSSFVLNDDKTSGTLVSNGITIVWDKNTSTNDFRSTDNDHVRIYAGANLSFTFTSNITKIVFACTSESYAKALAASTIVGGEASVEGSDVIVTPAAASPTKTVSINGASAQYRLKTATVYYVG